jgi:hypothetical protein
MEARSRSPTRVPSCYSSRLFVATTLRVVTDWRLGTGYAGGKGRCQFRWAELSFFLAAAGVGVSVMEEGTLQCWMEWMGSRRAGDGGPELDGGFSSSFVGWGERRESLLFLLSVCDLI